VSRSGRDCRSGRNHSLIAWFLDVDKNPDSAFIVVPVALMAIMLDKRMMLMMFVEPPLVVMIVSQSATRTDGNKENHQD
jgi:hypothetical protein